jgi:hypothetical protein
LHFDRRSESDRRREDPSDAMMHPGRPECWMLMAGRPHLILVTPAWSSRLVHPTLE